VTRSAIDLDGSWSRLTNIPGPLANGYFSEPLRASLAQHQKHFDAARQFGLGSQRHGNRAMAQGNLIHGGSRSTDRQLTLVASRFAEFALACFQLSRYFRCEPVRTKAHPFLSRKMAITLPSISWRLI